MIRFLLLVIGILLLGGCRSQPPSHPGIPVEKLPALPSLRTLEPGIQFAEVPLPRTDGRKSKLWVYLPEKRPANQKLPCVLIAGAGSSLFWGMGLGDGDRPEHLPYVREGFAVVAYELDGAVSEKQGNKEVIQGAKDFQHARFGIINAQVAMQYATTRLPVDPKRVYVAGHSSAATLALQIATSDLKGISACIAYAPCVDLKTRIGEPIRQVDRFVPGIESNLLALSPDQNVMRIRMPTFVFHARDDSNLPFAVTEHYARALQVQNPLNAFVAADSGDHYDSMIEKGVPAGIRWLKGIDAKLAKSAP
ncbi:MAG: alpha/beta fold hydrolase [Armatimonas sp.]